MHLRRWRVFERAQRGWRPIDAVPLLRHDPGTEQEMKMRSEEEEKKKNNDEEEEEGGGGGGEQEEEEEEEEEEYVDEGDNETFGLKWHPFRLT